MKNKTVYLFRVSSFLLFLSFFSLPQMSWAQSNQDEDYPTSDLYLLKDSNNQPLLAQLTKSLDKETATKIYFYPSSEKAKDSLLLANGLVFNLGQEPSIAKFSTKAEAVQMTKADSLAEIKRFEGVLYKNGKTSQPVKSHKGIIQPRFLKLYDYSNKNQIAEGSITAKYRLHQREEFVFKKSNSAIKLIVLENRTKDNYVLKLAFEGDNKFKNNVNAYVQLIGYAGDFSIPLGTFVIDVANPNYLYLPIEKELAEKLIAKQADYSLKFQDPVEYQFSELKLN